MITLTKLTNDNIALHLKALAELRIEIFRDYPYLYDGDMDYEKAYLETYAKSESAIIIVAKDHDVVIGASTGLALSEAEEDFQKAFGSKKYEYFYFGESVLKKAYRNQGIGSDFMKLRLAHAESLGFRRVCFCAVERPEKPAEYQSLDLFWKKRGFLPSELFCEFSWKDVGEKNPSTKHMRFWTKEL